MAESHVISALTSKRSELAGIIQRHKQEITWLSEEVKTLDAAIKLFESEYPIHDIKNKRYQRKNSFFSHGEANKLVLGIVRRGQPITATEIIEALATMKDISSDSGSFQKFKDAVKSTIRRQKKQGLIVETNTENKVSAWSVA